LLVASIGDVEAYEGGFRMARSNVAKLLVDTLAAAGVRRIYGVVGDSLNGMTECLRKQDRIEWIGVRHEEEDPGELPGAVRGTLAHAGPALLDVVVNRQELAMPPSIELEQAKGFTLYMMHAVLSGRGDEVFDLAKTNLWR